MEQIEVLEWAMLAIIKEREALKPKVEAEDAAAIQEDKELYDKLRDLGLMVVLEEQRKGK